jgi:SagB-type dehydrogenase family enzyme
MRGDKGSSGVASYRTTTSNRRWFLGSILGVAGGFALGQLVPVRYHASSPPEEAGLDPGASYHQSSKPGHAQETEPFSDWGGQPEPYKNYPQAQRINLPSPVGYPGLSLEETIRKRRSKRSFIGEPLTLEELSRLLYAAQGITDQASGYRAAPSAGALYPIEVYVVAHNVTGLAPGIYHYTVQAHALEFIRPGDFRTSLTRAGLGQSHLGSADACFILSAAFQRTRWKYHERAYRYVLLEAGHIAQNFCLAATALSLGTCPVGAFLDDDLNNMLGLDGRDEAALYIVALGKV